MTSFDVSMIAVLVGLIVTVGLFFLMREVFAWYFKTNQQIELGEAQLAWLTEIAATNEKILVELRSLNTSQPAANHDTE